MSKLTLDEAIKHCLDIADGQDKCADISVSEHAKERMRVCAANNRQLAEWLTELKEAKRLLKLAVKEMPTTNFCYLCKYKDYDKNECTHTDKCFVWRYAEELKNFGND